MLWLLQELEKLWWPRHVRSCKRCVGGQETMVSTFMMGLVPAGLAPVTVVVACLTIHTALFKVFFARGWIPEDILAKYQRALFFSSYLLMASLRHLIWQSRSRSLTLCAHKKTKVYCSRQLAQQCCCAWDTQFYLVQTDFFWRMCGLQFCFTIELFVFGTCSLTLLNKRPQKETKKVLSD